MPERSAARVEELAGAGDPEGLHADTRFAGSRQEAGCDGGALTGISETNLRPGPLIAAFADGIVDELARGFPLGPATAVVGLGNALRLNGTLRRAVERRLGVPCRIPEVDEMAAYGAAVGRNDE